MTRLQEMVLELLKADGTSALYLLRKRYWMIFDERKGVKVYYCKREKLAALEEQGLIERVKPFPWYLNPNPDSDRYMLTEKGKALVKKKGEKAS